MNAKICVALPTSNHLHRQMIEGVVDSARGCGPWQLFLVTEDDVLAGLAQARGWGATGVIALGKDPSIAREVFSWQVPAVLFNCARTRPPRNTVCLMRDQASVGKSAAEYFLDRAYTSFAFVGSAVPQDWSAQRRDGFLARLAKSGRTAAVMPDAASTEALRAFLRNLPDGTALFAAHDRSAHRVLGLCLELGITVPERLAVLGVDDDRVLCEAMTPPLSSISLDGVNSGRLAARLLGDLMAGKHVHPVLKLDFPRVVTRQSTDTNAIVDTVLARTLARITEDLSRPLKIKALADELGYSARTLELKARKVFGCTLKEKVNRIRLNEAVRLLSNSSLTVQEIAARCGFCGASHLGSRMKDAFGYPPSVFRP